MNNLYHITISQESIQNMNCLFFIKVHYNKYII